MNPEVQNGFACEASITSLPIWAHLDDPTPPSDDPPSGDCGPLVEAIRGTLSAMRLEIVKLEERLKSYGTGGGSGGDDKPSGGGTFGL